MRAKASAGKRAVMAAAVAPVPIAAIPALSPVAKSSLSTTPRAGSAGSAGSQRKGGGTPPLRGTVAAAAVAIAAWPKADAAEAYSCSVDDAYNHHCTMLHTADFEVPWMAFTIFIVFFAVVIFGTTFFLVRRWQR